MAAMTAASNVPIEASMKHPKMKSPKSKHAIHEFRE